MNNPVWEWLIRAKVNAYAATQRFNGPNPIDAGPTWCFDRFGQSATKLSDGRTVLVGGEHEDHYDPDFCIHNDVVIETPDGSLEIFGYPREIFPPTDFHSATLVSDEIFIIGSLGYPQDRRPGFTPVYKLNVRDLSISPVPTSGTPPGWIHRHEAALRDRSIILSQGKLDTGDKEVGLVENIDDWALNLDSLVWTRLTERRWEQWEFRRADGNPINLWQIRSNQLTRGLGLSELIDDEVLKLVPEARELLREQRSTPDVDLSDLYQPTVPHEALPGDEDEFGVFRIRVQGVTVRYVEELYTVRLVCEGELPSDVTAALVSDLERKLSIAESVAYRARRI